MRRLLFSAVFVCLSTFLMLSYANADTGRGRALAGPTLVAPGDDQDLSGKTSLEFRWSPEGDRSTYDHFDFRLYKGSQAYESGLILQKDIPFGKRSVEVGAQLFEEGQTYAWSVRAVGSKKSRSSYSVFKVIKK